VPVEEGALGGTAVLGSDQRKEVVSWPMSLPTAWLAAPIDGGIGGRRTGLEMTPQRVRVVWRQCMPYAREEASGRPCGNVYFGYFIKLDFGFGFRLRRKIAIPM
jgi:hypothetical protein